MGSWRVTYYTRMNVVWDLSGEINPKAKGIWVGWARLITQVVCKIRVLALMGSKAIMVGSMKEFIEFLCNQMQLSGTTSPPIVRNPHLLLLFTQTGLILYPRPLMREGKTRSKMYWKHFTLFQVVCVPIILGSLLLKIYLGVINFWLSTYCLRIGSRNCSQ